MKRIGSIRGVSVLLAGVLFGCGVPTFILQQYDGPVQSAEKVAIVRFDGKDTIDLISIDGSVADAHVPEDARLHVEMLPGKHSLAVANRMTPQAPPGRVVFIAEPGRYYRVWFVKPSASEWVAVPHVFEIDASSGARVKDATLTPRRDVPPARPAIPVAPPVAPVPPGAPSAAAAGDAEGVGAAGAHGE